jgi:hypothetical protein
MQTVAMPKQAPNLKSKKDVTHAEDAAIPTNLTTLTAIATPFFNDYLEKVQRNSGLTEVVHARPGLLISPRRFSDYDRPTLWLRSPAPPKPMVGQMS